MPVLRAGRFIRNGPRYENAVDNEALRNTMQDDRLDPAAPLSRSTPMALLSAAIDRDRALRAAAALEATPRWLDADQALGAVSAAIAASRPFSLLLLDAPLAAFVAATDRATRRLLDPAQRQALLDERWRVWFGTPAEEADGSLLASLADAFTGAVRDADIVCLPEMAEPADDADLGALAILRRSVVSETDALFAETGLVERMHRIVPYLRTLLAGLPFLGFIGAHPAMFRKLSHFCGVRETRYVCVPREAVFPVAEDGADPCDFLPERHAATLEALSVPCPGAVFLVSAPGPLGTIYAGRIKALGGIAIEIGPLAAKWAGG